MMVDRTFNSTAIRGVSYDESSKSLQIFFVKGGEQIVRSVSKSEFEAFCNAESVGRFFNEHFRNRS